MGFSANFGSPTRARVRENKVNFSQYFPQKKGNELMWIMWAFQTKKERAPLAASHGVEMNCVSSLPPVHHIINLLACPYIDMAIFLTYTLLFFNYLQTQVITSFCIVLC